MDSVLNYKSFCASIFLSADQAVKSISNREILSENPVELAKKYDDFGVDRIYIIDLSRNYLDHEAAHEIIAEIVKEVNIPVIVAGCIRNKSDIERHFDNGVSKVALNFSKQANIDLINEIQGCFEQNRLLAAICSIENYIDNKELIESSCSGLVLMKDQLYKECSFIENMPLMMPVSDIGLEQLISLLKHNNVSVIFGSFVNMNYPDINSIKIFLKESGILTSSFNCKIKWNDLKKNESGLVPVIVQDYENNEVLMMAYMNELAFNNTCTSGRMNYYSRSRKNQWLKGETSGHFQYVKSLYADCDSDTLLAKVSQIGAACHTGSRSCFFKEIIKREYF